jgi:sugar-phosphatase
VAHPQTIACSALLFDMDGTLVDSTAVVEHTWAIWADLHGIPLPELLEYSHGRPTIDTMNRFRPGQDWTQEALRLIQLEEKQTGGTIAIPGAKELLAQIAPEHWAVVTSAPRRLAESRIQEAGLPLPRVLVPVDEISNGKPHPEGYLKAAGLLGFSPAECLVFEDTRPGIEAGLNAGMQVIGLLTTVSAARLGCPVVIRDYWGLRLTKTGDGYEIFV